MPFPLTTIEELAAPTKGSIKIGPFGSQLRKEEMVSDGVKVYGQENVISGGWGEGDRRVSRSKYLALRSCELVPGDLVLTMMGTVGRCAIFPDDVEPGIMDSHLLRIQADPGQVDRAYLRTVVSAEELVGRQIARLSHGSIMAGLSSSIVRRLAVPLPPLPEQRRIAEILDTVDEAIRKTEQVIAKLKLIKQGLLHDLLTRGIDENGELRDPLRHPEQFKGSPLGTIPREWEVGSAASFMERVTVGVVSGATHAYRDSGVPFIRSQNVKPNRIEAEDLLFISHAYHKTKSSSELRAGDVVIVRTGYPGTAAVIPDTLDRSNCFSLVIARPTKSVLDSTFFAQYLNSPACKALIGRTHFGSAQHNFNIGEMRRLPMVVPRLEEQHRVIRVLTSLDNRTAQEISEWDKLRLLKSGLMEDLLTGRVRVKVPPEAA
ncbi:restriction endonuclease subunit S [Gemmatimonadota bacterium]